MNHRTGWSPDDSRGQPEEEIPAPSREEQFSTAEILQRLAAQTREYAATELERQRLRARVLGLAGRDAAILAIVALFLLAGALVALLVGCIITLAPLIGPLLATLLVVGVTLVLAGILLIVALARVRSAMRVAFSSEGRP